ncbi:hypothetical protein [Azovibrio restrictus]|uniref:hypothetical protein n=1 Tax=Azovibrio restrictus TaxID=146938 RepID=UPI0026F1D230|nr:hypothetical protein [Azovibrio restrictus]MDD3484999.1 hypothetical protein [Azovibrio restrictus]
MTTAAQQLAKYGLNVDVAREWIAANLGSPKTVFDICKAGGLNSSMIAEILNPLAPGLSSTAVESFFTGSGLDGSALRPAPISSGEDKAELIPDDLGQLNWLISMNASVGNLSTTSLHNAVLAELGDSTSYNEMFNPDNYAGSEDGVFTGAELGVNGLGSFAATNANLESLYYGTLINTLKSLDSGEVTELYQFIKANQAGLESGSSAVEDQLVDMLFAAIQDPAYPAALSDAQVASIIVDATVATAQIVGGTDGVFENAFGNLLG